MVEGGEGIVGEKKRTSRGGRAAIDRKCNQSDDAEKERSGTQEAFITHTCETHETINLLSLADKQQHVLHPESIAPVASVLASATQSHSGRSHSAVLRPFMALSCRC